MRSRIFLISVFYTMLTGCSTLGFPAISVSRIGSVVGDVKRQIAIYQLKAHYRHDHPNEDQARLEAQAAGFKCGNGKIDFDIDAAQFDLLSTYDGISSAGVTAGGAYGGGTVSGSYSSSTDTGNTQELKFNLYPLHIYHGDELDEKDPAPIADVLLALRDSLILSATKPGICSYDYNFRSLKQSADANAKPSADSSGSPSVGDTFKIGVTVTDDNKVSLAAGYSFVSVLLSHEEKTVAGNTVTVTFVQAGAPKKGLVLNPETGDPSDGQPNVGSFNIHANLQNVGHNRGKLLPDPNIGLEKTKPQNK